MITVSEARANVANSEVAQKHIKDLINELISKKSKEGFTDASTVLANGTEQAVINILKEISAAGFTCDYTVKGLSNINNYTVYISWK